MFIVFDSQETLFGWGRNDFGQLGLGSKEQRVLEPVQLRTDWNDQIKTVVAAGHHCLMVTTCGDLWVWGKGSHGQLALSDNLNRSMPLLNDRMSEKNVVTCAASLRYSAILTESNQVFILGCFARQRPVNHAWPMCEQLSVPELRVHDDVICSLCCGESDMYLTTTCGDLYQVSRRKASSASPETSRFDAKEETVAEVKVALVSDLGEHAEEFDVVLDEMLFHVSSTMLISEKKKYKRCRPESFADVKSTVKPPRPLFDGRGNEVHPAVFSGLSSPVFQDSEPERAETPGKVIETSSNTFLNLRLS